MPPRHYPGGGVATVLKELAQTSGYRFDLTETAIPVSDAVRGACEILGLDPLSVACEGRFVVMVPAAHQDHALEILRTHPSDPLSLPPNRIGVVTAGEPGWVTLTTAIGGQRMLPMPSGEQLPRIC